MFKGQEGSGADVGKVVTGLNPGAKPFFVMAQEGRHLRHAVVRDARRATAARRDGGTGLGGSDSATLIRDSQVYVSPGSTKNNRNPVGAGFRLK
ncbi:hypothetical protein ACFPIJ_40820 [Dactylosporangium cerinum]|uniref:Uncharacterized protein n=1 Tax=Dactylosporangium cerinum TaxID=1434730 RepID=A0ABV9WAC4_9ACTN